MDIQLLHKHIKSFLDKLRNEPEKLKTEKAERDERGERPDISRIERSSKGGPGESREDGPFDVHEDGHKICRTHKGEIQ